MQVYYGIFCKYFAEHNLIRDSFRARLKELMGDKSAYSLAKASGLTEATISRILNGKIVASLETIESLANGLGVKPYQLLIKSDDQIKGIPKDADCLKLY